MAVLSITTIIVVVILLALLLIAVAAVIAIAVVLTRKKNKDKTQNVQMPIRQEELSTPQNDLEYEYTVPVIQKELELLEC